MVGGLNQSGGSIDFKELGDNA